MNEQKLFKAIHHIGIVVRDVETTAKDLEERLGLSFVIRTVDYSGSIRGESVKHQIKLGHTKVGPLILELVQTVEGKTIYEEFLNRHGEGIHHIGVISPGQLDSEIAKWHQRGIEALQVDRVSPEEGTAYMDVPGCMLEILCFKGLK